MKYLTVKELRDLWCVFWKSKAHVQLPSYSLVSDDASLFWVNSGIAAIKPFFLGFKKPPSQRLFNIQKAVRTNDLNHIGHTNRHLSFFEMMGNFSLGNYFKKEAIIWAWEFLTQKEYLGLPANRLYWTYFENDEETKRILQKTLQIPDTHLFAKTKKTNFWDLGVGPCGPNLEIFYDLGEEHDSFARGLELLANDVENERYLEIWNIVFSEFLNEEGKLVALPTKNIDTGAGLERLVTVLQQKNNCFETEIFQHSRACLEKLSQQKFIFQRDQDLSQVQQKINYRFKVILDHLRTAVFLLTDVLQKGLSLNFQNTQHYIIRKLIRIALLQFYFLAHTKFFVEELYAAILKDMSPFYSNLRTAQAQTKKYLLQEEKKFWTLIKNEHVQKLFHQPLKTLSGEEIFTYVTTYGLPLEFIKMLSEKYKIQLNLLAFQKLWTVHQRKSRHQVSSFATNIQLLDLPKKPPTIFCENMINSSLSATVLGIFDQGKWVSQAENQTVWVIFDQTPFYAERGGQTFDTGQLFNEKGLRGEIINAQWNRRFQVLHQCVLKKGLLKTHHKVNLTINQQKRNLTRKNHSGTHLLNGTLMRLIDSKIKQTGSFNDENYLRFDFSTTQKITLSQLKKVEKEIQNLIQQAIPAQIQKMSWAQSQKLGAVALHDEFDIKKNVRVVAFGKFSIELCGGTHVQNTSNIEQFFFTRFESISQNCYRLYAITSMQTCEKKYKEAQIRFNTWWKKQNFVSLETLPSSLFRLLTKLLSVQPFSLLHYRWLQIKFQSQFKEWKTKEETKSIKTNLMNYSIPSTDFNIIHSFPFLFHVIEKKPPFSLNFLWALFDQQKRNFSGFLCFLYPIKQQNYFFVIYDGRKNMNEDWKKRLNHRFAHQIKVGGQNNKFQGTLQTLSVTLFKKFLQTELFKNSPKKSIIKHGN